MSHTPGQEKPYCSAHAYHSAARSILPCSRRAVVTEGGKPYCKQHAPSSVAARNAKAKEKWDAKLEAKEKKRKRNELVDALSRAARMLEVFELTDDADIADTDFVNSVLAKAEKGAEA